MLRPRPNDYAQPREGEEFEFIPGDPIGLGRPYPPREPVPMHPTSEAPPEPPVYAGPPNPTSLSPATGPDGTSVVINGTNFGTEAGAVTIGSAEATVTEWTDTRITVNAVLGTNETGVAVSATVVAADATNAQVPMNFTFEAAAPPAYAGPPVPTGVSPSTDIDGATLLIAGSNFGAEEGAVTIGTEEATVVEWTDTQITIIASQGINLPDTPLAVNVVAADATTATVPGAFTFTAPAADSQSTQSHKRKR